MTMKQFIEEQKINPHNCIVERTDGKRIDGFTYRTDAEYIRCFIETYGDYEVIYTYYDEYGNFTILV